MELMLGDGDAFVQFLPFWTYAAEQWKNLVPPFWTPHIFSGYPLIAEPQASIFHPLKILFFLFSPLAALNLTVLLYYGLAGLLTYLFAREEGLTPEAGLLAGISFALCGFLIGHQGITALFVTAASFPAIFYVLRRTLRKSDYSSILWGAGAVVFLVLGGHPQFFFYALFFSLFYAVYLFFFVAQKQQRKPFLKNVLAIYGLGIACSAFQLLPTWELTLHSVRDKLTFDDFVAPSLPLGTLLMSLGSTRIYHIFPNDGSEAMLDVGIMVLLLAGVAAARRRAGFWIFLFLFSALLFVGSHTPLYRMMFWVPGYNLFRVASRNGIALDFAVAMLAAHGLNAIQTDLRSTSSKLRLGIPWLVAAVYYVCLHLPEERIFTRLWQGGVEEGKALLWTWEMAQRHLAPLFPEFLTIAGGLALLSFLFRRAGGGRTLALVCTGLALFHFWGYRDWIFTAPAPEVRDALRPGAALKLPEENLATPYRIALGSGFDWMGFLQADKSEWRRKYVAVGGVDVNMLHDVSSISGYSPLILRRYSQLTGDMHMSGIIRDPLFFRSPALDLLNVKYVVVPSQGLSFPSATFSALEPLEESEYFTLYRNPRAPGMFWGVHRVMASSEEEFWQQMRAPRVDFSETALLTRDPDPSLTSRQFELPSRIESRYRDGNTIEVKVETAREAFLASSHPFYPGWFAWMDGSRTRIRVINGLFTGFEVPPGNHTLILRFIPISFWIGVAIATVSLGLFWMAARKDLRSAQAPGSESKR